MSTNSVDESAMQRFKNFLYSVITESKLTNSIFGTRKESNQESVEDDPPMRKSSDSSTSSGSSGSLPSPVTPISEDSEDSEDESHKGSESSGSGSSETELDFDPDDDSADELYENSVNNFGIRGTTSHTFRKGQTDKKSLKPMNWMSGGELDSIFKKKRIQALEDEIEIFEEEGKSKEAAKHKETLRLLTLTVPPRPNKVWTKAEIVYEKARMGTIVDNKGKKHTIGLWTEETLDSSIDKAKNTRSA